MPNHRAPANGDQAPPRTGRDATTPGGAIRHLRAPTLAGVLAAVVAGLTGVGSAPLAAQDGPREPLEPYTERLPGTLVEFDMVPVPAGTVTVAGPAGPEERAVGPLWIGRTEVTWDLFDVWAFRLDQSPEERTAGVDATSRPSEPYGAPDHGFGHQGYPAISMTYAAAAAFCRWLSEKTGRTYRLPDEAEWALAAAHDLGTPGEPLTDFTLDAAALDELAWYRGNAGGTTHPVASRRPGALGLHDMLGNAMEWVEGWDAGPATRGGSFREPAAGVQPGARAKQTHAWNKTDPQIPKSRWWLSDGFFVGFRIVRVPEAGEAES